jgi:hypothetical protein
MVIKLLQLLGERADRGEIGAIPKPKRVGWSVQVQM